MVALMETYGVTLQTFFDRVICVAFVELPFPILQVLINKNYFLKNESLQSTDILAFVV